MCLRKAKNTLADIILELSKQENSTKKDSQMKQEAKTKIEEERNGGKKVQK